MVLCFFIAEIGVNHNGKMELARELIDAAAVANADAVKFQSYIADQLVAADAPKASYQEETVEGKSQLEILREYELSRDQQRELMGYCDEVGITFLSTPFDAGSAVFLDEQDVAAVKLGSGELNNQPLLETVATFDCLAIVSIGMGIMSEVIDAYEVFMNADTGSDVCFLHCTSSYPANMEHVNLRAMESVRSALPTPVGYSDHTTAVETPAMAAAGATMVEEHLTLDRMMDGPDHHASMEPKEMEQAISLSKTAAVARGRLDKRPTPPEEEIKFVARKSLHANEKIEAGETTTSEQVAVKRPARGLAPTEYESVIGATVTTDLGVDEPITAAAVDNNKKD